MNDEAKGCLAILIVLILLIGSILAIGAAVFGEENSSERIAAYNAQAAQAQAREAEARAREEAARQATIQAQAAQAQAEVGIARARYEASVVWAQNGPAMLAYTTIGVVIVLALIIILVVLRGHGGWGNPGQQERIIILQLPPDKSDEGAYLPHYQNHVLANRPQVRIIGQDDPPTFT